MTKSRNPTQPPKPRTRSASRYKRSETSRLLQGAKDAGLTVRGIEVDPATGGCWSASQMHLMTAAIPGTRF